MDIKSLKVKNISYQVTKSIFFKFQNFGNPFPRQWHNNPALPRHNNPARQKKAIYDFWKAALIINGAGLMYCDYKPENAMVMEDGSVVYIDLDSITNGENNKDVTTSPAYRHPEYRVTE